MLLQIYFRPFYVCTDKISLNKCGNFIKHPVNDRDGLCLDNIIFTLVTPIKLMIKIFLMCRLTIAILVLCSVIDLLSKIFLQLAAVISSEKFVLRGQSITKWTIRKGGRVSRRSIRDHVTKGRHHEKCPQLSRQGRGSKLSKIWLGQVLNYLFL